MGALKVRLILREEHRYLKSSELREIRKFRRDDDSFAGHCEGLPGSWDDEA